MREFNINKNPYGDDILYDKENITIEPGLSILVGCNGCGKTTFLRCLREQLKEEKVLHIFYSNLTDGGEYARSKAGFLGDFDFLATAICSSEGENIVMNLAGIARDIGCLVRRHPDEKEMWLLFDAIDSGLSIDNVLDIKKHLFDLIFKENKDKKVYIVVAANGYEMCKNEKCFDVCRGEYIKFNSYDEYFKFIIKSREKKQKRDEVYIERLEKEQNKTARQ